MFRPENLLQVALRKTEILSFCLSLLVSQGAHPGRDGAGTQPAASAQPESSAPAGLGPGRGEPSRVPVGAAVEEPPPPPCPPPPPPIQPPTSAQHRGWSGAVGSVGAAPRAAAATSRPLRLRAVMEYLPISPSAPLRRPGTRSQSRNRSPHLWSSPGPTALPKAVPCSRLRKKASRQL